MKGEQEAAKPKVAIYWCASCGGCDEAILDMDGLLEIVEQVELTLWPVALDFKYADLDALEEGELAVALINGAIRTSEQEEMAKRLRRKAQLVVAFGACAAWGGVPALANLGNRQQILQRAYRESPTVHNPDGPIPRERSAFEDETLELPRLYSTVLKLDDVIDVDYYLPGCPPAGSLIGAALKAILAGELPPKGTVLGPTTSLCSSCDRNESKPERVEISRLRRITEVEVDPELCFLAQGLTCMGPATRDGCEQPCINGNMPCTGCYGPTNEALDQGAKMVATLGGILRGESREQVAESMAALVDPAGTFYRYGLSASLLGARRGRKSDGPHDHD